MRDYSVPCYLTFTIMHVENDPSCTMDSYSIDIEMEWREASDETGDTSKYDSWYVASNGRSISYHGEDWYYDDDSLNKITWRNLRRELKRAVLLDCLSGIEHLNPIDIQFEDDSVSRGNPQLIDHKYYGIDIKQYLCGKGKTQ